ncbi:hypothetical protein KKE14_00435 [Patescibacteria group bacterium]|nr:hypothetical protein [Patescibacteria group bacterium]
MLITPHLLAGAVIADKVGDFSWPVVVLALISHFILDAIPHRDEIDKNHLSRKQIIAVLIDLVVGIVLIWLVFREMNLMLAVFGAGVGILPDIVDNAPLIFKSIGHNKWWQDYHHFHGRIQQIKPNWGVGLLTQIIVIISLVVWLNVK